MKGYKLANKERITNYMHSYRETNSQKIQKQLLEKKLRLTEELKANNQLKEILEAHFKIQSASDWYGITQTQLNDVPIAKVFCRFFSLPEMLKLMYPTEDWIIGRFKNVSKGTWKNPTNVREYLLYLEKNLHIKSPEDWNLVSKKQMIEFGAKGLLDSFSSLHNILSVGFPEIDWKPKELSSKSKKTMQRWLKRVITEIFPTKQERIQISENYLHPAVTWDNGESRRMEIDIWIPSANLGIEYQGEQHFHDLQGAFGLHSSLKNYVVRDKEKKEKCSAAGLRLVTIPYWWDGKKESLTDILYEEEVRS